MSVASLPSSRQRRLVGVLSATLALTTLALALALIFPQHARANTHPGGNIQNPVILNIDIARPAVVRIETAFRQVTINVRFCTGENDVINDPHGIGALGSGAFISAKGDILTAGHVVKAPPGDLESFLLQDPTIVAQIIADIQKKCGKTLGAADVLNAYLNNPALFLFTFAQPVDKVWLDTSYNGPYSETSVRNVKFFSYTVEQQSNLVTSSGGIGNDVAIIKIDGFTDTPSIPVGDSDAVAPTDSLTIIGYPGNGDANHYAQGQPADVPTDFLTQSINQVYVSALKTNDGGGKLIQVGGNVEHGDSGGPALNTAGEIVGVVSFGGPSQPDGTSFFQASSNAKPLITQANVDTTPGTFQNLWRQALTDFAATSAGHWHKAVTELSAIQASYPNFKGADDYLTYAQQQTGNDTGSTTSSGTSVLSSTNNSTIVGIGLAALAGIALVVVVIAVIAGRSRAKPQAALVPVAVTAATSQAMPQPGSAPYGYPTYPPSQPGFAPPPYGQQMSAPAPSATTCTNGHAMQPNEVYCSICRAPRAQA